jgi:hypothetical protein
MPKKKMGRPSVYSPELASDICKRLAIGESLVEICREDKMPGYSTVMDWLFMSYKPGDPRCDFPELCARAREVQAETFVDQMVVLADQDANDVLYDLDGHPVQATTVRINRHRLQIDTRWRIITKLLPRFSDRPLPESVDEAIPIEAEVLEPRELARQVALILYRGDPKRLTHQKEKA